MIKITTLRNKVSVILQTAFPGSKKVAILHDDFRQYAPE